MNFSLSPRSALVLIAALFIGPLIAAWLMYAGVIEFKPAQTRNLGQLVEPPVPLDWSSAGFVFEVDSGVADRFLRHWVVLHPVSQPCGEACEEALVDLRQVHRASGRHQDRILLAVLVPPGLSVSDRERLAAIYDRFMLVADDRQALGRALGAAGPGGSNYLVDPLGNIMMRYEAGTDPNHLKQDLKRLLTWSKLDENQ
jgi:hypothetical protein